MILDFNSIAPPLRYQWMTQAIIPRPVAWILSENDSGNYNLAPFSYFNALASDPPLIGVSFGNKEDGENKDTLHNIRARQYFVVHIASMQQLGELNNSAATRPYGESEVSQQQLATTPLHERFALPRLQAAPLALACRLHQQQPLGNTQTLVIGEIIYLYADECVLTADAKGRQIIDAAKVSPVGRLSAGKYAGLGDIVSLPRPE
ncbi:MAG: flavin reductase family protein [Proteobacteria bacterium]|nr:flavin reductase family protein [Pseudomonadota bacterium]